MEYIILLQNSDAFFKPQFLNIFIDNLNFLSSQSYFWHFILHVKLMMLQTLAIHLKNSSRLMTGS